MSESIRNRLAKLERHTGDADAELCAACGWNLLALTEAELEWLARYGGQELTSMSDEHLREMERLAVKANARSTT